MSVFQKMSEATDNRDADAYVGLMSDDFTFVRHQDGSEMTKAQTAEMLNKMMSSGSMDFSKRRCIYENDDILVTHSVNDYPDGSREAVMAVYTLRDGKITRLETGATPLGK